MPIVSATSRSATLRKSFTVSFIVGLSGIAFGAASVAAGFSVLQSCVLSLLTFSGASQFALVGIMGAGGSAISGIATASFLGIRNGLYGLRMAPIMRVSGIRRILAAHVTIDESTGVALSQEDLGEDAMRTGFWFTGFGVFIFWNLFTLLGALGAQAMGDPAAWGLDAAVPALFLGIVWPKLKTTTDRLLAGVSLVASLALTPFLPAGLPIISTALIAIFFGMVKK